MRVASLAAVLVALLATAALGGVFVVSSLVNPPQRVVLLGEAWFPDMSGSEIPDETANGVLLKLTVTTLQPWVQGHPQTLEAVLEAVPGPGVQAVAPTTLFIYLARPRLPNPDIVTGDADLLEPSGTNRWTTLDGPIVVGPNPDVLGSDLFLTFSVSLNVDYRSGSSYGWGGWRSEVRMFPIVLVSDLGATGAVILVLTVPTLAVTFLVVRGLRPRGRSVHAP